MKKYASIFQRILLLFLIIFTFGSSLVMAYGKSEYEYQHIYPRQYFQSLGDPYTFKVKEFEHRWIHVSKGYDNDWKDVKENTPWISRILGDNYLLTMVIFPCIQKRMPQLLPLLAISPMHFTYMITTPKNQI